MITVDLLDKNLDKEWFEEYAEGCPIFLSLPAYSVGCRMPIVNNQYKAALNFYYKGRTHWFTLVKDQEAIFNEVLDKHLKNSSYFKNWFKKWIGYKKEYSEFFEKIRKTNLSEISETELFLLHDKFWGLVMKCRSISMFLDCFMFRSEGFFINELNKYCNEKNIKNFSEIYSALTAPENDSFIGEYELELIMLAMKYGSIKKDSPEALKIVNKYCWSRCNWGNAYLFDYDHLIKDFNDLKGKDLIKLKREKTEIIKKNKANRKNLMKTHTFNPKIRAISDLGVLFIHWQDLRKENALKYIYGENLFLSEFARRYGLNAEKLKLFDRLEIDNFLKNKKRFNQEAKKRQELFIIAHHDCRAHLVFGKKVKYYLDKLSGKIGNIDEIKGVGASPGKVRGKVRIIHEGSEFHKFMDGEILVTGMTRPEFVVLMKKASGIVTNEGGITSHAAIVSRELGKPAVISTRIATKVFKDGDLVEVDADKGIVRKVK